MHRTISLIIVTYGNRAFLVKEVINASFEQGVDNIVLVDNASYADCQALYDDLIKDDKRVHLLRNDENLGSSGGFKVGLEYVIKNLSPDFVWLLDDDNVPQQGSLKSLVDTWNMITKANNVDDLVLYSYRGETREHDKRAVTLGEIKGYSRNNFMGFNFFKEVRRKIRKQQQCESINYPVVRVTLGPYGGAFFNLNVLNKIGLPRSDFYVYADDHEYTLRLNDLGIQQYLVYGSRLKDIDISFDEDGLLSPKASILKVYYSFRNHTYLSQRFKTNKAIYIINKHIFIFSLSIYLIFMSLKHKNFAKKRFKIICQAINDGERSLLGMVECLNEDFNNSQ